MTLILPVRPRALHQPSTQAKLSRFDAQSNIDQFVIFINAVTGCAWTTCGKSPKHRSMQDNRKKVSLQVDERRRSVRLIYFFSWS